MTGPIRLAVESTTVLAAELPGRDEAARLVRRELSDPVYAEQSPGVAARVVRWFLETVSDLRLPTGLPSGGGLVFVIVAGVLLLALVLWATGGLRIRRARSAGTPDDGTVFGDVRRTAAEHRRLADRAATAGDWDTAVRERFRAVARSLEERTVLDPRPGRTAMEVAREAAPAMGAQGTELAAGAHLFDDVVYGARAGTPAADSRLRELDAALGRTRPSFAVGGVGR